MKKLNEKITIKTSTTDEFMGRVKEIMRLADKKKFIKPSHTISFEDPTEMLHFLTATKIRLINFIRKHPDSISNIAKAIKRNRASVYRDIHELEQYGLVKVEEKINPGHGRHKIVQIIAPSLKLEAYI